MIRFLDGPAEGQILELGRAPLLLRAVVNVAGEWDALDQLDDEARKDETIHVYWLAVRSPSWSYIDYRDKAGRRRGSRSIAAAYVTYPDPPDDEVLRDNQRWRSWCLTNEQRIREEWERMMKAREAGS